jgi:integrase
MRLGEAMNRYLETVLLKKPRKPDGSLRKSVKIIVNYLRRIEQHFGRKTPLAYLCRPGVIADYNHTLLRSMKPISANKYLTFLRAVMNRAYDWGALEYRPRIKLNPVRWAKNRYLSPAEEKRLVQACPPRIRPLVEFMLDTGARKEEVLSLTWNQVSLRRKPRSVVMFVDTKNGDSRVVPLPKRTARNLAMLARTRPKGRDLVFRHPATRDIYKNDGTGLYARKGQLVPISALQTTWEKARARAGLPDCRLHDLRHTYASRLVRSGAPIFYVARLLGHKTIGMTMRYSHLAPLDLDRVVSVLD